MRAILSGNNASRVVVVDNLVSGSLQHLGAAQDDPRLGVVALDVKDGAALNGALREVDHVFHFAANPDIAKAMTDPTVDFWEGTYLTQNVLEACRQNQIGRLTYASGSGVYGDRSHLRPDEVFGPLEPVSAYGASKLACEAMISSYVHMFGLAACAFRFANVVGDGQTHGVTYDFVRKLRAHPHQLAMLGDGTQEKSYVHVDDVVRAMLTAFPEAGCFEVFNVGTDDTITVNRIAELVMEEMRLSGVEVLREDTPRGWKGDVPVVRLDYTKIKTTGWRPSMTSEDAIRASIRANILEADGPPVSS